MSVESSVMALAFLCHLLVCDDKVFFKYNLPFKKY